MHFLPLLRFSELCHQSSRPRYERVKGSRASQIDDSGPFTAKLQCTISTGSLSVLTLPWTSKNLSIPKDLKTYAQDNHSRPDTSIRNIMQEFLIQVSSHSISRTSPYYSFLLTSFSSFLEICFVNPQIRTSSHFASSKQSSRWSKHGTEHG